jgi:tetratricopeptide (TPR) repeat protein
MFDKTVTESIESNPSQRFESADAMRAALDAALAAPEQRRARRRAVGWISAGLVAAAALGVGVAMFKQPELRERAVALFRKTPAPTAAPAPAENAELANAESVEVGEGTAETSDQQVGEGAAAAESAAAPVEAAPAMAEKAPPEDGDEDEAAPTEPVAKPSEATVAAQAAGTAPAAAGGDEKSAAPVDAKSADVAAKIAEASALIDKGQRVKGFNEIRRIGRNNRKSPAALKAWSETAARMKAWGEAARVARQWAAVDPGAEAQLHLARMQRAVGKREEAVATLQRLLTSDPQNQDARSLMRLYGDQTRVARR